VRDGLGHVVVTSEIPPSHDNVDKAQIATYQRLRAPLPLTELPSADRIHEIADRLAAEFPWALKPIGAIVREALARKLLGAQEMGGMAILLVGPPGCGKTRLARRLAEEFGLGFLPIPMGGQGDPKILTGTSRGWAGGQPSPIITAMLTMGTGNPLILVDEIDKSSESSAANHGPAPITILLGMTERENSQRWRDLFLQATCDLSKVLWVATANQSKHLSKALLDRFRVIEIEAPSRAHMATTLPYIAADLETEWNLPAGALPALPASLVSSGVESLRDLRLLARTYVQDWAIENAPANKH
jgi:MoxR-like ATPase